MYYQNSINKIITNNEIIKPDGFSSYYIKNTGEDNLRVNDNILLEKYETYSVMNMPDVIINEKISIVFTSFVSPKALIIKYYNNLK
jgi:hypothetical protein